MTTDGDLRLNGMRVVKNMDDVLFFHSTLEEAIKELERFLEFCRKKNLKLKPSKFCIGEEVEFGGALITSETVGSKSVVNILPKSQRVQAFQNLCHPRTRSVLRHDDQFDEMGAKCSYQCPSFKSSNRR